MPNWSKEQFTQHPKHDSLLGVNKNIQSVASTNVDNLTRPPLPPLQAKDSELERSFRFIVPGIAVGKPRMTQRDVWKKRPCVLQYREYCDRIRAAAPKDRDHLDCYGLDIIAHVAVKPSWPKKKQNAKAGKPHRSKPDADNIIKSVGDALFVEDSGLWDVRCRKFWCALADERTEIRVLFGSTEVCSDT